MKKRNIFRTAWAMISLALISLVCYWWHKQGCGIWIAGHVIPMHLREQIAINDGLTLKDWDDWFSDYDKTEPLAIIHFTKFRY